MNSDKYKLMEYLFELMHPLDHLLHDSAPELFNKPALKLSEKNILTELKNLYESGLIGFFNYEGEIQKKHLSKPFDSYLQSYILGLTREGGELIESRLRPNWSRFLLTEEEYVNNCVVLHVSSQNESIVQRCIDQIPCSTPPKFEKVSPWEPFYWKQLDVGYEAKLIIKLNEFDESKFNEILETNRSWVGTFFE